MYNILDVQMILNFLFFIELLKCAQGFLYDSLLY